MISIIIPAHNEELYLKNTLKSIINQEHKDYEIIVSCNACTDKTDLIAKKYADKVINLKQKGVSIARNQGAKIAKGNLLVFLDADTLLEKNTLTKIKKASIKNNVVGTCKAKPDKNKLMAKIFSNTKNLLWHFTWSNGLIFCNKELFNETKGFNESLTKRETRDFIKRAKTKANYVLAKTYVISSTRRFEKKGYMNTVFFWIKEALHPTKEDYETVR